MSSNSRDRRSKGSSSSSFANAISKQNFSAKQGAPVLPRARKQAPPPPPPPEEPQAPPPAQPQDQAPAPAQPPAQPQDQAPPPAQPPAPPQPPAQPQASHFYPGPNKVLSQEEVQYYKAMDNHFLEKLIMNAKKTNKQLARELKDILIQKRIEGKDVWTGDEDDVLLRVFRLIGPDWPRLAKYFPNKTENEVYRRCHWLFQKTGTPLPE